MENTFLELRFKGVQDKTFLSAYLSVLFLPIKVCLNKEWPLLEVFTALKKSKNKADWVLILNFTIKRLLTRYLISSHLTLA